MFPYFIVQQTNASVVFFSEYTLLKKKIATFCVYFKISDLVVELKKLKLLLFYAENV